MKKLFVLFALALSFTGGALAQEAYFGVSGAAAYAFDVESETVITDTAIVSPGAQLGVRNLLGPFGLRLTAEYSVAPVTGLLEVGGDVLFNFGTVIDPYIGLGAGIATIEGGGLGIGRAFAGLSPRFGPNLGLFAEAVLTAFSDGVSEAFTVKARGGVNFFF